MDLNTGFPRSPPESRSNANGVLQNRAVEEAPLIWALEAFPNHDDLHLKTAAALGKLYPQRQIIPVYVLSEESFTERGFSTFLKPALKPMAKKALATLLSEIRALRLLPDIRRPRVLVEASASRPACARKLLRFASKIGASDIAVGSHARGGFARFFVGGFSEALLDEARIPILVTGPHADLEAAPIENVIFPTDFSIASVNALPGILSLCARLRANLHIFHRPVQLFDTFKEHLTESRAWQDQAVAFGVKTVLVGQNFREPMAEGIVQYAIRLGPASTLIALVSQTKKAASAFLGNVTRDVIRTSPCPVFVAPREA